MALQHAQLLLLLTLALALPESQDTHEVEQRPRYVGALKDGSVKITCSSKSSSGFHLLQDWPRKAPVIYYQDDTNSTVDSVFLDRVVLQGPQQSLTITMHRLRPADSGLYVCQTIINSKNVLGSGTLLLVTDRVDSTGQLTDLATPVALTVVCFFVGLGLGVGVGCILQKAQVGTFCWKRDQKPATVVYEDMSFSRHNTLSRPYQ